ncbi:MAG: hypothetical protein HDT47_08130 [Ruminococcaceae bacterium]|nr:hypothetical protein [Oscillospiraceae bacterium]
MFVAPVPLIRKNHIIKKLRECKAFSPETAVTFEKAGIINPHMFKRVNYAMIEQGILVQCGEKYYLNNQ